MKTQHFETCEAPICAGDPNENYKKEALWYPGEIVCRKTPMQKFQRIQRKINKRVAKGTFKYLERYFTAGMLEKVGYVTNSTKGCDPDR